MSVSWAQFDPEVYVADNYLSVAPEDQAIVEQLVDFYAAIDGDDLDVVEVGGGPNMYPVMASLLRARQVRVVEYGPQNVDYARKQLGELSPNWHLFWDEIQERNPAYAGIDLQRSLADRVSIELESLYDYFPRHGSTFDVVSTHFCIESISDSRSGFQRGMDSLSAMTKTGGHLIASFLKGSDGYSVGEHHFPAFALSEQDLVASLEQAGYGQIQLTVIENSGALSKDHEWLGMIVASAVREDQSPALRA